MPEHTPAPTPGRAVYGFVLHLTFKTFFILYLAWALIPESLLEKLNVTYMPQRYWAVSIPVFLLVVLATFAFVIYPSLNLCMLPNLDDLRNIEEDAIHPLRGISKKKENEVQKTCCCKNKGKCFKDKFDALNIDNNNYKLGYSVPVVEDLERNSVCKLMYLEK